MTGRAVPFRAKPVAALRLMSWITHAGTSSPMSLPSRLFRCAEAAHGRAAVRGEDEVRPVDAGQGAQDRQGRGRERHDMGRVVLRPLAGERPEPGVEVQFRPPHLADFVPALAREDEQPHQRTEGPADAVAGRPEAPQLVVGQDTVAGLLRRRRLQLVAGRGRDDAAVDAPVAQLPEGGQHPVRHDGRAAIDDGVEQLVDVGSRDVGEVPAAPRLHHLAVEDALRLFPRALVGFRVALDELVDDFLDEVTVGRRLVAGAGRFLRGGRDLRPWRSRRGRLAPPRGPT